jgi:type II secretory pathway component PulK
MKKDRKKKTVTRRGSALVTVIWVVAVLSLIILNFAAEAKLQSVVNRHTTERVRVNSLTDAGKVVAEVILMDYQNVSDAPEDQSLDDMEEEFQEDRWIQEKRALKGSSNVDTGAILVDAQDPDSGTVSVHIEAKETKLNINTLWSGGNQNWLEIWENILAACNVPEEYWNELVCSWNDWRDPDDSLSQDLLDEYPRGEGGEAEYYKEELKSEDGTMEFEPCKPRNGEISDLKELAMLKGFREHPVVLTGGVINPEDKEEDQITVKSILDYFDVIGTGKVNVNAASKEILLAIPGIADDLNNNSSFAADGEEIVQAIIDYRSEPSAAEAKDTKFYKEEDYGSFKDFSDLQSRIQEKTGSDIGNEASNYLIYAPETYFEITIVGASAGISHTVKAVAMVQDSKVRYIRWQEDP